MKDSKNRSSSLQGKKELEIVTEIKENFDDSGKLLRLFVNFGKCEDVAEIVKQFNGKEISKWKT